MAKRELRASAIVILILSASALALPSCSDEPNTSASSDRASASAGSGGRGEGGSGGAGGDSGSGEGGSGGAGGDSGSGGAGGGAGGGSASASETLWRKRFGDAFTQVPFALDVDPSGNIVLGGSYSGSVDFGGGEMPAISSDAFLAKLDAQGQHLFSHHFGGDASGANIEHVATDAAGNIVVTGVFEGTIDLGGGPMTATNALDLFIAKFDAAGAYLWSTQLLNNDKILSVGGLALDASGAAYITGFFSGSVDLGGSALTAEGISDIYVAKFDAAGGHVAHKTFGGADEITAQEDVATAIAVDAKGDVWIGGSFVGEIGFGGPALTSSGKHDVFVAKLDSALDHLYSARFGDAEEQGLAALSVDALGNVALTGSFEGSIDFGGGPLTSPYDNDLYVAKLAPSGAHVFSKRYGDTEFGGHYTGKDIAFDAAGDILLTGAFRGDISFGGGTLSANGTQEDCIVKLDASGGHVWSQMVKDENDLFKPPIAPYFIAPHPSGNVVVAGSFLEEAEFHDGKIVGEGGYDIVLMMLSGAPPAP